MFYSAVIGFTRSNNYNKHIVEYVHLALDPIVIMQESDIKVIKTMGPDFDNAIDNVRMRGSGFKVVDNQELKIHVVSFIPLSGSSYIPLPKLITNKKAIINIQNKDQECF